MSDQVQIIELKEIYRAFGGTQALSDVSFDIKTGEVHALIGENGAGKSTLIKIITGVLQPDSGEIFVDRKPVVISNPLEARNLGFAAVYQEPLIYPYLSVMENMFVANPPLKKSGSIDRHEMRRQIAPIFSQLEIPHSLLEMHASELRLGDQQLVLIAAALLQNARLVIFDEPTSILSASETERLFRIIKFLRESGKGVAYISHRLEELEGLADRVTVLTDGHVVGEFDASKGLDIDGLYRLIAGVGMREYTHREEHRVAADTGSESEVVLEVSGLSNPPLYSDLSWSVHRGEVLGFYGQVGSGRSEMAMAVYGLLPAQRGAIRLEGRDISPASASHAIRRGIGYLPEDRKSQGIFGWLSIRENLISVILPKLTAFIGHVLKKKTINLTEDYRRTLKIKIASTNDPILSLSGGHQQKVMLGRWLAEDLKVLILDEPTRGIDVGTKREFHRFIRETADQGLSVVVISSDLPEVLAVSDVINVMRKGRLVATFRNDGNVRPEDVVKQALAAGE